MKKYPYDPVVSDARMDQVLKWLGNARIAREAVHTAWIAITNTFDSGSKEYDQCLTTLGTIEEILDKKVQVEKAKVYDAINAIAKGYVEDLTREMDIEIEEMKSDEERAFETMVENIDELYPKMGITGIRYGKPMKNSISPQDTCVVGVRSEITSPAPPDALVECVLCSAYFVESDLDFDLVCYCGTSQVTQRIESKNWVEE